MFKDKVYEEMDEISRMFEPFQFNLNDELALLPDKIEVLPEYIMNIDEYSGYSGSGTNASRVVKAVANSMNLMQIIDKMRLLQNNDFFRFEVEGDLGDGEQVKLDGTTMTMSHKVFVVKNKLAFDEQELEKMRKEYILGSIKNNFERSRDVNKPRFNEIADIYGAEIVKSERSYYGKVNAFVNHMEKLIDDKVLDIRDMDLCHKFVKWIVYYVKNGNLAALNNLTRIKIITHEKRPIYSIEEKEVL